MLPLFVLNPHPARGVQLCIISRKKNVGWKWAEEGTVRLREEKCSLHPKLPLATIFITDAEHDLSLFEGSAAVMSR